MEYLVNDCGVFVKELNVP